MSKIAIVISTLSKWGLMRLSKLMVSSKPRFSRYVLLGQREARIGTVNCPYLSGSEYTNPPTPWGHEACRWSLKPKPLPPLVSSHYPKLILRGEVYLSPPPLHWVVAPAFNICSDYSRSRNLIFPPRAGIEISTFFIFEKTTFLGRFFKPRRFSLEVSSKLKSLFFCDFNFYL